MFELTVSVLLISLALLVYILYKYALAMEKVALIVSGEEANIDVLGVTFNKSMFTMLSSPAFMVSLILGSYREKEADNILLIEALDKARLLFICHIPIGLVVVSCLLIMHLISDNQ